MSKKTMNHRLYRVRGAKTAKKMLRVEAKEGPNSKPGFTERVYCPECTDEQQKQNNEKYRNYPQYRVHMTVVSGSRTATCPNGHTFAVRN